MPQTGRLDLRYTFFKQPLKPKWERRNNFNTCPVGRASSAAFTMVRDGKIFASPAGGTCLLAFDFQTGKKLWTFASPMTYLNGVLYASNTYLWALEESSGKVLGVSANFLEGTSGQTVHYDAKRNQLLLWGDEPTSFKPVR